jgi:hypothetical protein
MVIASTTGLRGESPVRLAIALVGRHAGDWIVPQRTTIAAVDGSETTEHAIALNELARWANGDRDALDD